MLLFYFLRCFSFYLDKFKVNKWRQVTQKCELFWNVHAQNQKVIKIPMHAHKSDFSKESKVDFDSGYERLKIILLFASSFNSLIYRI